MTWLPNNSAGHYRKATAVALGFISTNSGGIAVSASITCFRARVRMLSLPTLVNVAVPDDRRPRV